MDKNIIRAMLKETGERVELVQVGDDLFLDEKSKNVYHKNEFIVEEMFGEMQNGQKEFVRDLFEMSTRQTMESTKSEIMKMIISFKANMALELMKKRPFMSAERIVKKTTEIFDGLIRNWKNTQNL